MRKVRIRACEMLSRIFRYARAVPIGPFVPSIRFNNATLSSHDTNRSLPGFCCRIMKLALLSAERSSTHHRGASSRVGRVLFAVQDDDRVIQAFRWLASRPALSIFVFSFVTPCSAP
jgi:hypothetical protein